MTKNRYQNDQINLERTKADQMAFGFNNLQSFVINSCNHYITAYILHNYKLTFTAWNFLGKPAFGSFSVVNKEILYFKRENFHQDWLFQ